MEKQNSLSRQDIVVTLVGFALVVMVIVFFVAKHSVARHQASEEARQMATEMSDIVIPSIAPEMALQKYLSPTPPRMIDLRSEVAFAAFHIPDSYLVNVDDIAELPFVDGEEAIIISDDLNVLHQASDALASSGITHFAIEGGLPAWETVGGQVVTFGDPNSPTDHSKVTLLDEKAFSGLFESEESRHQLLDVRSSGEKLSESALWIPLSELEARRGEIPPATSIALCGENGLEAFQASVRLFDLGFASVQTLDGSCDSLLELSDSDEETVDESVQ
jgi:rhodanese-related sulfurtransferase